MGEVWQARLRREHGFEKLVAVKLLRAGLSAQFNAIEMLLDEARLAANINSPHVVTTFDLGIGDGGETFIVMEFVDGVSLAKLLREVNRRGRRLPMDVALEIIRQVATGLHHAHQARSARGERLGLIHRDVSPDNILVGWDGWVKLTDFGVAYAAKELEGTQEGGFRGKYEYASPEQLQGAPLEPRSDVFGLGVVAWEALAGRRLFRSDEDGLARVKIVSQDAPGVQTVREDVPEAVAKCIAHALRRVPDERLGSAAPVAKVMSAALRSLQATSAGPASLSRYLLQSLNPPAPAPISRASVAPSGTALTRTITHSREANSSPERHKVPSPPQSDDATIVPPPASAPPPTNIPSESDIFFGRTGATEDLLTLLESTSRLVTLTGPGGTGKTRLATHVGRVARERFPGGVWLCDLTAARSQEDICSMVAESLGIPLRGSVPLLSLEETITARGEALFILDNFEQVIECAPSTIGAWIKAAPMATFLVTSRTSLAIAGERIFPLAPLHLDAGVDLFFDRARSTRPGLERTPASEAKVRTIVAELDGLCLAIELSAARLRVLTLAQIASATADRFTLLRSKRRDLTDRQRTLWGSLEWSWDLLTEEERWNLAQLSVFDGPFDAEAFAAVLRLEEDDNPLHAHEALESLVDQSLIQPERGRGERTYFRLLMSIREYASRKMQGYGASEHAQLTLRHMRHYQSLASGMLTKECRLSPENRGLFAQQRDNFVSGFTRALEAEDWAAAATLGATCGLWSTVNGSPTLLSSTLPSIPRVELTPIIYANLIHVLAQTFIALNQPKESKVYYSEGLAHAERAGVDWMRVVILNELSWEHRRTGDTTTAILMLQQALRIGAKSGAPELQMLEVRHTLTSCYLGIGELQRAMEGYKELRAAFVRLGDLGREADIVANYILCALAIGDLDQAEELLLFLEATLPKLPNEEAFRPYLHGRRARLHWARGELKAASEHFLLSAAGHQNIRPAFAGSSLSQAALATAKQGDLEEAAALMSRASRLVVGKHDIEESKFWARKAELQVMLDEPEAASESLAKANALATKLGALPGSEIGQTIQHAASALGQD